MTQTDSEVRPVAEVTLQRTDDLRIRESQHLWNTSLLHFGHGDATSLGTGRVKCFT
jgi:hypothetical protein